MEGGKGVEVTISSFTPPWLSRITSPSPFVVEDELVSYRLCSRVTTTPRPPPPSSISIYGEGRRNRSDSLFLLVENIFSSTLLFSRRMRSSPSMVEGNFSFIFLFYRGWVSLLSCMVESHCYSSSSFSSLLFWRGGRRSRGDHLLFDDREHLLIHRVLLSSFFSLSSHGGGRRSRTDHLLFFSTLIVENNYSFAFLFF